IVIIIIGAVIARLRTRRRRGATAEGSAALHGDVGSDGVRTDKDPEPADETSTPGPGTTDLSRDLP
ncbi:hypothetical protein G3I15_48120, partial [Streptomyces sp. SID10244]|nr:hypothetical protein [Streptomyces sp. SID10244]